MECLVKSRSFKKSDQSNNRREASVLLRKITLFAESFVTATADYFPLGTLQNMIGETERTIAQHCHKRHRTKTFFSVLYTQ